LSTRDFLENNSVPPYIISSYEGHNLITIDGENLGVRIFLIILALTRFRILLCVYQY